MFTLVRLLYLAALVLIACKSKRFRPKHSANGRHLKISDIAPPHRIKTANKYFGSLFSSNPLNDDYYATNHETDSDNPIIYITDFGGDPFGVKDSTAAFIAAINETITKYGAPNVSLAEGVKDCGGATIHLGGGDYLVSKPIIIPSMVGNLRIIEGTIRASSDFTPSQGPQSYILNIGELNYQCNNSQGSCNENVAVENLMLDCKQNCDGGLFVTDTMGTVQ